MAVVPRVETVDWIDLTQYTKDEFIMKQATENALLSQQVTDTQLALCEVYEMML